MEFIQIKKKQLSKSDKSSIGKWDNKIVGLCNKLNNHSKYYTTSSCAGRVVLIKEKEKKQPNSFLFRTHKKISLNEIKKVLRKITYKGLIEFKMSGCILHVACADLESAQKLVDKAKFAGWKRSGIMATNKRFIVELVSTEIISFLIMDNGKVLVDDDFLKIIVEQANNKLIRVWKKIEKLEKSV